MLTKRQKQVLDLVKKYTQKHGYAPSLEELAKKLGLKSPSTIHDHIKALQKKGFLEKERNQARSIEISTQEKMVRIPLRGTIAAGHPIETYERVDESIALPKSRVPHTGTTYALQVIGDSMIEEGIYEGDIVIVKEQGTAENGQKIVALVDGEATLKKFYKERSHIRLQPANKKMEPIIVRKGQDFRIQGIVIDVIQEQGSLFEKPSKEIESTKIKEREAPQLHKKLPLNQILCGDVIEELKKLDDETIDVILADPPYNIGKDFGNDSDKRELAEYIRWSKEWTKEAIRVLKPNGTIFIYGFSEILAHISVELPIPKRWLIWHYTNKNVASLNFWQRSHESIICAWKNKPTFNRDEVREPYTEGFLNGAAGKVRTGTVGRFSKNGKATIYKAHEKGALPRDVIKVPALAGGAGMNERWFFCKDCDKTCLPRELKKHLDHNTEKHPTQKPLELSKKLIQSAIPEKEGVVLVPFVGSGTECLAAKQLKQDYIGIEINPEYVKMATEAIRLYR